MLAQTARKGVNSLAVGPPSSRADLIEGEREQLEQTEDDFVGKGRRGRRFSDGFSIKSLVRQSNALGGNSPARPPHRLPAIGVSPRVAPEVPGAGGEAGDAQSNVETIEEEELASSSMASNDSKIKRTRTRKLGEKSAIKARLQRSEQDIKVQQSCCARIPVFSPRHRKFVYWDFTVMTLLLFTAVVTPFEVAFLTSDLPKKASEITALFVLNRLVDLGFICDILLQFNLAVPSSMHEGVMIIDRKEITRKYLRGWFTIDILSSLPYDTIGGVANSDDVQDMKVLRVVRLLRVAKLLRMLRAGRIMDRLESALHIDYSLLTLIKFVFTVIFSGHWLACSWRMVPAIEEGPETWVHHYDHIDIDGTSLLVESPWRLYVVCYYWAIATMSTIGYGDVVPSTDAERVFSLFAMVVGASIYAYIFGSVCAILQAMDTRRQEFRTRMDSLNTFMMQKSLPNDLRVTLRNFFRFQHRNRGIDEWHTLLGEMSPKLRRQVANHTNAEWLTRLRFFRGCDEDFITDVSLAMRTAAFPPMEHVIAKGEFSRSMYIVERGIVGCVNRLYTSGKVFGEDCMYSARTQRRAYSATTLTYSCVFRLAKDDVMAILQDYPSVARSVRLAVLRGRFRQNVLAYVAAIKKVAGEAGSMSRRPTALELFGTSELSDLFERHLREALMSEDESQARNQAAISIQRHLRGLLARRKKEKFNEARFRAIMKIQIWWRLRKKRREQQKRIEGDPVALDAFEGRQEVARLRAEFFLFKQDTGARLGALHRTLEGVAATLSEMNRRK